MLLVLLLPIIIIIIIIVAAATTVSKFYSITDTLAAQRGFVEYFVSFSEDFLVQGGIGQNQNFQFSCKKKMIRKFSIF